MPVSDCSIADASAVRTESTVQPSRVPLSVPPPAWTEWFTPGRFALLLGLLIGANFASLLLGTNSFFLRDFGYFSHPLAQYHRDCFWRGELPQWNPHNLTGMPYLAQWNTLTLYPGSLIYLLLPLPWSLNLFCLAHLFVGGLGMYVLAQRWTQNRFAASAAGLLFVFNGFTLNCLMWPNNIAALGLMPWVVLLAQRGWQEGGRKLLLGALVGGVQMLSGAPEMILLTWAMAGALFVVDACTRQAPVLRGSLRAVSLVAMVAGLAAVQLLPFLELMQASERSHSYDSSYWPIPLSGWANLFVPLFRTARIAMGSYFQPGQEWVASYYTGVCGLVLALTVLWKNRNARVWLLVAMAGVSLAMAFGDNGFAYPFLRKMVPQLAFMRFPVKFLIVFNFVLPLLAAYALARWEGRGAWLVSAGVTLAVIGGILWFAQGHPGPYENWAMTLRSGLTRAGLVVVLVTLLWALARTQRDQMARILAVAALLVFAIDGITHSPQTNPVIPAATLKPGLVKLDPPPGLHGHRAMLTRPAYDELYVTMISDPTKDYLLHRLGLTSNCNLVDSLSVCDGFFSLYLREHRQLWVRFWMTQTNNVPLPLMDFMSVAHVNAKHSIFDWTNRASAQPIATIGRRPVFADAPTTLAALTSPEFNPSETVYLSESAKPLVTANAKVEAAITAERLKPHRMEYDVTAKGDTLLVLAQSYYAAWRATVDGKPAPILRANHAFQAVAVPAGTSRVVFEYRDPAFRNGVIISLGTVALGLALWFLFRGKTTVARSN